MLPPRPISDHRDDAPSARASRRIGPLDYAPAQAVVERLLDLLYPPRCVARDCGYRGAWLCSRCLDAADFAPAGRLCDLADASFSRPEALGVIQAGGYFVPPLSNAVRALKYRRLKALAPLLAARLIDGGAALRHDALMVPVPAHPRRVSERGIDHTSCLAMSLSRLSGHRLEPQSLRRTRATETQTGLSREMRRLNLQGAFEANPDIAGYAVILVDDVLTTGSTALACADALIQAGASRVDLCVVAIADRFVA
jgi:ComF family protein